MRGSIFDFVTFIFLNVFFSFQVPTPFTCVPDRCWMMEKCSCVYLFVVRALRFCIYQIYSSSAYPLFFQNRNNTRPLEFVNLFYFVMFGSDTERSAMVSDISIRTALVARKIDSSNTANVIWKLWLSGCIERRNFYEYALGVD